MRQKDDMDTQTSKRSDGRSGRKSASAHARTELARILCRAYGPEPDEPIPPKMMELLDQLEAAQKKLERERAENGGKRDPEEQS